MSTGGVYLDLDFACLQPMDEIIDNAKVVLAEGACFWRVGFQRVREAGRAHSGSLRLVFWLACRLRHETPVLREQGARLVSRWLACALHFLVKERSETIIHMCCASAIVLQTVDYPVGNSFMASAPGSVFMSEAIKALPKTRTLRVGQ